MMLNAALEATVWEEADAPEMLDPALGDNVRSQTDGDAATPVRPSAVPQQRSSARTPSTPTTADRATSARIARGNARGAQ